MQAIHPIFAESYKAVIGHNLTWLCKTVGSEAGTNAWTIPHGQMLSDGEYSRERHCVQEGNCPFSLHPEDSGGNSCAAENKHGNSSRKVHLEIKVIDKFQVLFI